MFLRETHTKAPWADDSTIIFVPARDKVDGLRTKPLPDVPDIDAAEELLLQVIEDLRAFGTGGVPIFDDAEMRRALLTLDAVLKRVAMPLEIPFRDLESFRSYWIQKGCANSYQARRDLLDELFNDHLSKVISTRNRTMGSTLVDAISPHDVTGWPKVDVEIAAMRQEFRDARTAQNCRAVGLHAVAVLTAVSEVAYDHARHGDEESEPRVVETKKRLERVVAVELPGSGSAEIRKLARAAIEAAERVKHGGSPTRTDAGIIADATLLVANMMRRLRA